MTFTISTQALVFASGFIAGVVACVILFFIAFFHAAKQ